MGDQERKPAATYGSLDGPHVIFYDDGTLKSVVPEGYKDQLLEHNDWKPHTKPSNELERILREHCPPMIGRSLEEIISYLEDRYKINISIVASPDGHGYWLYIKSGFQKETLDDVANIGTIKKAKEAAIIRVMEFVKFGPFK